MDGKFRSFESLRARSRTRELARCGSVRWRSDSERLNIMSQEHVVSVNMDVEPADAGEEVVVPGKLY